MDSNVSSSSLCDLAERWQVTFPESKLAILPAGSLSIKGVQVIDKGEGNFFLYYPDDISIAAPIRVSFKGNNNYIALGRSGRCNGSRIDIIGNYNKIIVGRNFNLDQNGFRVQGAGSSIVIDSHLTCHAKTFIFAQGGDKHINIGRHCLFSTRINIRTNDGHGIFDLETMKRVNIAKSIVVHDRVWIGEDAKVLKGAIVNSDSVIGAASIVTREVPANCVVAGNPARVVRTGIFWNHSQVLPRGYDHAAYTAPLEDTDL
ncbi:acyltransferase [Humitalea sp. 24SJ18S-53]|uniref:acyltransferase n=1 Tax=Humitalea sp. 24SJ18S-53 TaxID=3422307 RepID=UPI003D67E3A9